MDATLEQLFEQLRPKLHRYCARMTGSVIDGEDVVQEALVKALAALPRAGTLANPEGWLFRIAHNTALDFLRQRARHAAAFADDEDLEMIADPTDPGRDAFATVASLRTFMRLPTVQRSAVILVDVLGYTLADLGQIAGGSILKSALQRGRARLRELTSEPDAVQPPALTAVERARLLEYAARFNARDFDAVRDMLADDVRLDLVNRLQRQGRSEVGEMPSTVRLTSRASIRIGPSQPASHAATLARSIPRRPASQVGRQHTWVDSRECTPLQRCCSRSSAVGSLCR